MPKSDKAEHDEEMHTEKKVIQPLPVVEPTKIVKEPEVQQPPVASANNADSAFFPQEELKEQSSLLGAGGAGRPPSQQSAMPGGMSAYEQMLFQQFADGNDGADALMGGGPAGAGFDAGGGPNMSDAEMAAMQEEMNVR